MTRLTVMLRGAGVAGCLAGLVLGGLACVEQTEEKPTEQDMEAVKKNLLTSAPTPKFPVNADLDGKIVYLGMDASAVPVEPGKDVILTHYWKVVAAPGAGWRLFTHLNGPNNSQYLNVDHGPVNGKYPVSQWKAGDIIKDEHPIRLPVTWPHDKLFVHVGLWRSGGERMPVLSGAKDAGGRVIAATLPVTVKAPPPAAVAKRYVARKAAKPIKIDGKLDEAAWKAAPSTGLFVKTMNGAPAEQKTEAKLLWDKDNLYLAFEVADTDVWSTLTKRDDKLWTQEAVEVMIDADRNGKSYIELQVAPSGNVFDTYLPEYRKYENDLDPKRKQYEWTSKAKVAVKVDGTLNKREDQDKGWVAEIAIPHADVNGLNTAGVKVPPKPGDTYRINLFRMDIPTGKGMEAYGWSPPLVGDFHALDKFGELAFGDEKGALPPPPARPDPHAVLENAGMKGIVGQTERDAKGELKKAPAAARRKKPVARESK